MPTYLVSIIRSQEIVFAFIVQSYVSQVIPRFLTIIGASLVVISAMCIPLENFITEKLPQNLKKYF